MTSLRKALPLVGRCFLCGRRFVGVFEPPDPWNFSPDPPAPGKVRRFYYGLCESCLSELGMPEVAERVEARIKAELLRAPR